MQNILVYGDSISWGAMPGTYGRFPFAVRWPGVMEQLLLAQQLPVKVYESCLCGRRSAWDDPLTAGRNGLNDIAQAIEMHSPLSLLIVLLGNNDLQYVHGVDASMSGEGVYRVIEKAREAARSAGVLIPTALLVLPPALQEPQGLMRPMFIDALAKQQGMAAAFQAAAKALQCHYMDTRTITACSPIDGVHLDEKQHLLLGQAMAIKAAEILLEQPY